MCMPVQLHLIHCMSIIQLPLYDLDTCLVSSQHDATISQLVCRVTLIEAQQLLGTFDAPLREYAANKLNKQGVHLLKVSALAVQLLFQSHQGSSAAAAPDSALMFCLSSLDFMDVLLRLQHAFVGADGVWPCVYKYCLQA